MQLKNKLTICFLSIIVVTAYCQKNTTLTPISIDKIPEKIKRQLYNKFALPYPMQYRFSDPIPFYIIEPKNIYGITEELFKLDMLSAKIEQEDIFQDNWLDKYLDHPTRDPHTLYLRFNDDGKVVFDGIIGYAHTYTYENDTLIESKFRSNVSKYIYTRCSSF